MLSGLFVWRWVMETKGMDLEDMHGQIVADSKTGGEKDVTTL